MLNAQGAGAEGRRENDNFVVYVADGNGATNAGSASEEIAQRRAQTAYTNALYFRLADMALNIGLLVWQQLLYRGTWGDKCDDHSLKVWSTVWLGSMVLRSAITTLIYVLFLRRRGSGAKAIFCLELLLEAFVLAWYLYGIHAIFVNWPSDDCSATTSAKAWSLFGWIVQSLVLFFPCILFLCCVPCLMCLARFGWVRTRLIPLVVGQPEATTNQTPAPEDVMARLVPTTYGEAMAAGTIQISQPAAPPSPMPPPSVGSVPTHEDSHILNQMRVPNLTHTVAGLLARFNSSSASPSTIGGGGGGAPPTDLPAPSVPAPPQPPVAGGGPPAPSCPICQIEFAPEDEILQLPCDPTRHVFHASCVQVWLSRSQHCPLCRMNIVDIVRGRNEQATRETVTQSRT